MDFKEFFDTNLTITDIFRQHGGYVKNGKPYHQTRNGELISVEDLSDDHLRNVLPKLMFSMRRFVYLEEAKKRGITL